MASSLVPREPLRSFERYFRPGRSLWVAALVVFGVVLVDAVLVVALVALLDAQVESTLPIPLPGLVLSTFLAWFVNGVLLHAVAWLLEGDGSFRDALVVSAWGLVPTVLAWVTALVGTAYLVFVRSATASELGASPVFLAGTVLALVCAWYVWLVGLQGTHGLSRRRAAVAAGVVAALVGVFAWLG